MNAETGIATLAKLREPFPPRQISKLPKETRAQIEARKADKNLMVWKCPICGGPHHKNAVHLDYVGHAALTDRLLDTDPAWSWEPLALDNGLPALDRNGGLWIKLTVCGVTRLGYGSADGKSGGDAIKEIIGDALRNAAMRFGAALDLWHKGDLHGDEDSEAASVAREAAPSQKDGDEPRLSDDQFSMIQTMAEKSGTSAVEICKRANVSAVKLMHPDAFDPCMKWMERKLLAKSNGGAAADGRATPVSRGPQASDDLNDDIPY